MEVTRHDAYCGYQVGLVAIAFLARATAVPAPPPTRKGYQFSVL